MVTITPEILDRVEIIRESAIASIKLSTVPDELAIDLRQAINHALDTTVENVIKAMHNPQAEAGTPALLF